HDAPRRLHQQGLDIRMRTAHHPPAPLLLARAVLARDQTEIARPLRRPTEARRVIQRGDIRAGGNRTDARQRCQAANDGVLAHVGAKVSSALVSSVFSNSITRRTGESVSVIDE